MPITDRLYSSGGSSIPPPPSSSNHPPSYTNATRPTPPPPQQPTQYGSLSDLTSGRQQGTQGFQYTPQPERQGYRPQPPLPPREEFDRGHGEPGRTASPSGSGRNMPPPPSNYGRAVPREPPRRNVAEPVRETPAPPSAQSQSGWRGAAATAGSYVPNSVSATATSVSDRAQDTFRSVFTQERKGQVMNGAGKAAAGAAKLAGKAAWNLGKYAKNN